MLLADIQEEHGPQDQFKMTYEKQKGEKDFPDKVNVQKHWNMNTLTKQTAYMKDFKPIQRWSEEHKSYASDSEQRLF